MYQASIDAFDRPGGCKDQTIECQRLMKKFDPDALGNNEKVNSYCLKAMDFCQRATTELYLNYTNVSIAYTSTLLGLIVWYSVDGLISPTLRQIPSQNLVNPPRPLYQTQPDLVSQICMAISHNTGCKAP
jgi:hypothetical protein